MQFYKTKSAVLPGTDFREVHRQAFSLYQEIVRRSKRRPYVRSVYFDKDKIFLTLFWHHLWEKKWQDRMRRLKYYAAALELIQKIRFSPTSKENPNKSGEVLHRFKGVTIDGHPFYVQIKESKRSGRKDFISVFPAE